jgi:hypothetical protein
MAAAMLFIPFPILLGVLLGVRPPAGADFSPEEGVAAIVAHPIIFASSGLSFTILGLSLIVLALALHEHLRAAALFATRVAAAAGVIGGALLMLVGLGPLAIAKGLPGDRPAVSRRRGPGELPRREQADHGRRPLAIATDDTTLRSQSATS